MYKKENTFDERIAESTKILKKYPDKIPLIIEKSVNDTILADIDRNKYLVPNDLSVGQIIHIIRKRLNLTPTIGIFVFCNNIIVPTSNNISTIYQSYKDEDQFLYFNYSGENTFGF